LVKSRKQRTMVIFLPWIEPCPLPDRGSIRQRLEVPLNTETKESKQDSGPNHNIQEG